MIDQNEVCKLLKDTSEVIGLNVCFHDRHGLCKLPESWRRHSCMSCERVKETKNQQCVEFDMSHVHRLLLKTATPIIIECHAGYTQIVLGVYYNSLLAGVIFAGPCWVGENPPDPELKCVDRKWLEPRVTVLEAVAQKMNRILVSRGDSPDRKQDILFFLQSSLHEKITLSQLASKLHLSESRTSHLVKDLFGETLPQLLNNLRMQEAARLLSTTDWPIVKIAAHAGYTDQNYFSRIFHSVTQKTPREYRMDTSRFSHPF